MVLLACYVTILVTTCIYSQAVIWGDARRFPAAGQQYEKILPPKSPLLSWSWALGLDCLSRFMLKITRY
jgi:hypothetical protein